VQIWASLVYDIINRVENFPDFVILIVNASSLTRRSRNPRIQIQPTCVDGLVRPCWPSWWATTRNRWTSFVTQPSSATNWSRASDTPTGFASKLNQSYSEQYLLKFLSRVPLTGRLFTVVLPNIRPFFDRLSSIFGRISSYLASITGRLGG